jgi:hypothetical protein
MSENKFEFPIAQPEQEQEEELNLEEREQLKTDMGKYVAGLKTRVEEIKVEIEMAQSEEEKEKMRAEMADLEEQSAGLDDFAGAIDEAESIKIKPHEGK